MTFPCHSGPAPPQTSMSDGKALTIGELLCSPVNRSAAPYTRSLLAIERRFDHCWAFTWLSDHWTLCFPCIAAYLLAIFAGQRLMRNRPPFELRRALLLWNIALALFSAVGAWRTLTAVAYDVATYGMVNSICELNVLERRQAHALWNFLFSFSKIVEFGDTAFLVLRKRPLLFLHWYHHVSVTVFAWSPGAYGSPVQGCFTTVNYCVHAVMYSYFALRALGVRLPRPVGMAVTAMQLLQMGSMITLTVYGYRARVADPTCAVPPQVTAIACSIYASYFGLFLHFFFRAYVRGKTAPKKAD